MLPLRTGTAPRFQDTPALPARGRIGRAALDYHHAGFFQAFEQLIRVFAFPVSIASVCLHAGRMPSAGLAVCLRMSFYQLMRASYRPSCLRSRGIQIAFGNQELLYQKIAGAEEDSTALEDEFLGDST